MCATLTKTQQKRADHQARIAACRAYHHALLGWERGYLASLTIMLRREPVLQQTQLGILHEIHLRASACAQAKESQCQA